MLKPFLCIKKIFNTLLEILIINYKIIILLLILLILIALFLKFKSIIITKIKQLANIIISKIKQILNNIYKIKFRNLMYISISTILFFIVFEFIRYLIPNKFNIHLVLNLDIDFLTSYSCVLGLILPLAMFIQLFLSFFIFWALLANVANELLELPPTTLPIRFLPSATDFPNDV